MTKTKDDPPVIEAVSEVLDDTEPAEPEPGPKKLKPGDPDYDWAPHYPDGADLYRHEYPNGTVVQIRRFGDIYSKQWLRSIRHLQTDFDIESEAVDRAACPEARSVIDAAPSEIGEPDHFEALWKAWSTADTDRGDGEGLTTGN